MIFDLQHIIDTYTIQTTFLNKVAQFYQHELYETPKAYDYVMGDFIPKKQRGISFEMVQRFQIGYASDSLNLLNFVSMNGLDESLLYKTGIFKILKDEVYDYFHDRIIFPILDIQDNVIGFSGRIWREEQEILSKFVNSPDTEIYKKSFVLYGLNTAIETIKEKGFVWIVEGIPDVIALNQAGIYNAVSAGGTYVTVEHLKILKYFTNNIALCFDNDSAGVKALSHITPYLRDLKVYFKHIFLKDVKDADELLHQRGVEAVLSSFVSPF